MKYFKLFESFINESMETIVGEPHEFNKAKKNISDYQSIIQAEVAKKFDLSTDLFKADFIIQLESSMGDTKMILTLPNSSGDKEKEKLANKIADFINKLVEKNSKIKGLEYAPTASGKVANASQSTGNGNWQVIWQPKFFVRKS